MMDKTKKGIALFITLLIIAYILTIVAISFSYLEKTQNDANEASSLIQGNLLYKNTTSILLIMQKKGMRILNFMRKSSKKLLVHYEMDEIEVKGSIDIVLTPQRVVKLVTLQPTQEDELWVRYL